MNTKYILAFVVVLLSGCGDSVESKPAETKAEIPEEPKLSAEQLELSEKVKASRQEAEKDEALIKRDVTAANKDTIEGLGNFGYEPGRQQ